MAPPRKLSKSQMSNLLKHAKVGDKIPMPGPEPIGPAKGGDNRPSFRPARHK